MAARGISVFGFAITVLISCIMPAGADVSRTLSIKEAVDLAMRSNRRLLIAETEKQSMRYEKMKAYLDFAPRVEFQTSVTRVDERSFEVANQAKEGLEQLLFSLTGSEIEIEPFLFETTYRTGFVATQPIYNGGRLWAQLGISRRMEEYAREQLEDEKWGVSYDVQATYLDVLKAAKTAEAERDAVASAREWVKHMRRQYEVGSGSRADILRWETQLASSEFQLTLVENEIAVLLALLKRLVGIRMSDEIELIDVRSEYDLPFYAEEIGTRDSGAFMPYNSYEGLERRMLARHPALKAMVATVATSEAGVKLSRSNFLPSVNVSFQYGWHQDDDLALDDYRIWSATLSFSYPLFDALGRGIVDYRRSKAEFRKAEHAMRDLEDALKLELLQVWRTIEASKKNRLLAEKAEEQAGENLRIVEDQFRLGIVENVVLLDAQAAHHRARVTRISADYDYFKSLAALIRALGGPVAVNGRAR